MVDPAEPRQSEVFTGFRFFIIGLSAGRCVVNVLCDFLVLDATLAEIAGLAHVMYSQHTILRSFSYLPTEWIRKVHRYSCMASVEHGLAGIPPRKAALS